MELYQVKYFLALCETLNFARAADRCHVSQPSLTRAVQKLEQELGGLLIRRERRSTHLTELGKLMRPMLEEVCGQLERTKSHAQRHVSGGRQTLKLGFLPSIGPLRLASVLARFSRENPGVELRLSEATLPVLSDLLFSGELDAAVIAYAKRVDKHLRYFPLYTERLVCAAPWGHPFERFEAVRLSDLRDQAFLWRSNCENADLLLETCRQQGFELRIVYRSAREDWIQAMVAAGCGVTIIPEFSQSGSELVTKPLIDPNLVRELSLVTVAGRPHGKPVAWILRALRTCNWSRSEVPKLRSPRPKSAESNSRAVKRSRQ